MSSTAEIDDIIEVSADGLTVRKRFAAAEFPVPAICFEIESDHDEPVTFRLSEEIPELFPMDRIGFHPQYASENWTAFQDNHIELTGTLEANESFETVYGIRIDEADVGSEFLTEPTIEVRVDDAPDSDDDPVVDTDEQAEALPGAGASGTDSGNNGDGASVEDSTTPTPITASTPASDDEAVLETERAEGTPSDNVDGSVGRSNEGSVDSSATDLDLAEEPETAAEIDADAVGTASTDDVSESGETDSGESRTNLDGETETVSGPAREAVRAGGTEPIPDPKLPAEESVLTRLVAELRDGDVEDELTRLRAELNVEPSTSELAKIGHLQLRVEEVAAYSDALEQFLDEEGTGTQLVDGVSTVETRLDDVDSRIDNLETDVDSLTEQTATLESELDEVQNDVAEIQEWRDQLGSMFTNEE
jgi:hypothetical protein